MRSVLERTGRSSSVRDLHGLCGVMTAIGEPWPAVDETDVLEACLPAQGAITVAQVQSRATGQVGEEPLAVWTLHELPVPCLLQGMAGCITRVQQRTSGIWLVGAQQIRSGGRADAEASTSAAPGRHQQVPLPASVEIGALDEMISREDGVGGAAGAALIR